MACTAGEEGPRHRNQYAWACKWERWIFSAPRPLLQPPLAPQPMGTPMPEQLAHTPFPYHTPAVSVDGDVQMECSALGVHSREQGGTPEAKRMPGVARSSGVDGLNDE